MKPLSDREKSLERPNIDLGLAVLSIVNREGQRMTLEEIADVCECSIERVRQIEARALAKMRSRLSLGNLDDDARELVLAFIKK